MLTDMGSQFTSSLMAEVSRLLSMRQLTTILYHPMGNGLVGRFNGTMKQMLKRVCAEKPKDWDRYVSSLLFAYRTLPQESLGFSPFELLYGRTVRRLMMILKEFLTKELEDTEVKTTYQYIDLQNRLGITCGQALDRLAKSKARY
jgi:transposase InsO family protein